MCKNDHLYCLDPHTGIVYRTVGFTDKEDLVLYPKYVPSVDGVRENHNIRYRGIHYPTGSIRYLATYNFARKGCVDFCYSPYYNCFLPQGKKKELTLLKPREVLLKRIDEDKNLINLAKELMEILGDVKDFGLDASMLACLECNDSDIDMIVYGKEASLKARACYLNALKKKKISSVYENSESIIRRRVSYSPLMSNEEILLWETKKISSLYKGVKFSFMPIDPDGSTDFELIPTNLDMAIRVILAEDKIVYDPGVISLDKDSVENVYGPRSITISKIFTYLPSRMGVFLSKGDIIFVTGRVYMKKEKEAISYVLTQFPWDDNFFSEGSKFVMKIEQIKLDNLVPRLLGQEFKETDFTA